MKPIDIALIIFIIVVVIAINSNFEPMHFNNIKHAFNTIKYKSIPSKKFNRIIEKLDNNKYYGLSFALNSRFIIYKPDDCLPLNFAYDSSANTLTLNGSGSFVATDYSFNPITISSIIKLNLVLSNPGESNTQLSDSNINFNITTCLTNPAITITNNSNNSINLLNNYESVSGTITIGSLTFPINPINFTTTTPLTFDNDIVPIICGNQSCSVLSAPSNSINSLAPVIPASITKIDELVKSGTLFALYTTVVNKSIPLDIYDQTPQKMYLSVSLFNKDYDACDSNNGILYLSNKLTQGSIFNVSEYDKKFIRQSQPYKYLDFNDVYYDNFYQVYGIVSKFYNMASNINNKSVTYCMEGCDQTNINGLCAQEVNLHNNNKSKFVVGDDINNLKNLMKFKIESDGSVTPYFISFVNNIERIYFITNKISTKFNANEHKKLVQVPIYPTNESPYYNEPLQKIQDGISYYFDNKVEINGLTGLYEPAQTTQYNEAGSWPAEGTFAFKNDAYKKYALKFFIEIIDPTVTDINSLPMNDN